MVLRREVALFWQQHEVIHGVLMRSCSVIQRKIFLYVSHHVQDSGR
jgi:hypothetical protein